MNNHTESRRVRLLNLALAASFSVCFCYAIINIAGALYLAIFLAVASILSLLAWLYFQKSGNLKITTIATVALITATLSVYFIIAKHTNYALIWLSVLPLLVYFLIGNYKARIFMVIYSICVLAFLVYLFILYGPGQISHKAIVNIMGAMFTVALLTSYYEMSMNEAAHILMHKNQQLAHVNDALSESREQLRLILDSTAEAILGVDLEGNCTFCNNCCVQMLGYLCPEELLGEHIHQLIHHSHKDGTLIDWAQCGIAVSLQNGIKTHYRDGVFWRKDGTCFDVEYTACPQFRDGEIVGAVITFQDITLQKQAEEKEKYLSTHDFLTGLYNRCFIQDNLASIAAEANLPLSVVYCDLNGLKLINDIFGHAAGDTLLIRASQVLLSNSRQEDIVARIGGDEFLMLLPKTDAEQAKKIMEGIKQQLWETKVEAVRCSMAMGHDTKISPEQDIDQVMENAESEMYKDKIYNRKFIHSDMIHTIITTLHDRSPREKMHSESVANLCQKIGQAMNLPESEVRKLKESGYYHDIGKIVVNPTILIKQKPLSPEEKKELQQHSVVGYKLLNLFDDTLDLAEGVYSHHERYDGTGYPKGLKGDEIPVIARIIAIAEAFDALTNPMSSDAVSKPEALLQLQEMAGQKLDPHLTKQFIAMMQTA